MKIKTIGVIGAGQMGHGIAQVAAASGFCVILYDIKSVFLQKGISAINGNLSRMVAKNKLAQSEMNEILDRIILSLSIEDMSTCDIVIEAATENFEIKAEIFKQLDKICPRRTILATNTSSISITRLAAVTERPGKIIGMHFMNPVPVMELVEVVRGEGFLPATVNIILFLAKKMGKTPVPVNDYPGFIANSILCPMIYHAIDRLEQGIADKEGIDKIITLGLRHPMGPLTLADFVGLDTLLYILEILHKADPDKFNAPPHLLVEMVNAGKLGRKSGEGFYKY